MDDERILSAVRTHGSVAAWAASERRDAAELRHEVYAWCLHGLRAAGLEIAGALTVPGWDSTDLVPAGCPDPFAGWRRTMRTLETRPALAPAQLSLWGHV